MNTALIKLTSDIISGHEITYDEALGLDQSALEDLLSCSRKIMDHFNDRAFDFCTIINGKSGHCSEDCTYCAQSIHYDCDVEVYDLLDSDTVVKAAQVHEENRVSKFSVVTSGKRLNTNDFEKVTEMYKALRQKTSIKLCASHGLLNYTELKALKKTGVHRYHNNLETSRKHFKNICTTHTYDEKIETIKAAQQAGLEVCSGGIIGLGESMVDRIDLAFELKALGITSIPLNILNPIAGTPLYGTGHVAENSFYKTCAIFRFIHPKATIRLAGGRALLSDKGKKVFESCVNGSITGELLTTTGNDTANDMKMVKEIGYETNN
jgi:biotin synthase